MTATKLATLFAHDDGRHAVWPGVESPPWTHGDPGWHRVGPVDVDAIATPQCLAQIEEPAGAAPAAVAPQGDEDDSLLLCASDLQHSAIYDSHSEMQDCARSVADRIKALAARALAAPALEAPGAREVTVERYEIPGGMRSALEDVISYLRSHGRCDLVRLMQELYTAISPWDGGSCSDVPDALVPARPDAEYLLSIARNNRWPMLMRAHIKSAALATAPALEAPAAPVGSARQFIEWMYSQPEDREPTTAEGALLEFEAHLAAAAPQAPAAPAVDAWLQPDDMAALQRFHETAEDDESYDIGKEAVARLCAFGCLQSHSFGRYSTTDFGDYLLDTWAGARTLPFTTAAERAAQAAAKGE